MAEQDVRDKIAAIDEKRARAVVLDRMSDWPMFSPSRVEADKKRGVFRWFGAFSDVKPMEVELTRAERSELRDWLHAKSTRLNAEADAIAETLEDS